MVMIRIVDDWYLSARTLLDSFFARDGLSFRCPQFDGVVVVVLDRCLLDHFSVRWFALS